MRYHRQELILGPTTQKTISNTTVAIVGVGALGTVCADLLARAGFNLIIVDRDIIELTNLQRQSLFTENDVGKSKAIIAENALKKINSKISITPLPIHLHSENIHQLLTSTILVDCTDNLQTRFLLNRFCKKENKPLIYGAAIKESGYVMTILNSNDPCLECFLQPASLETCDTVGVLNTITHIVGSMQAQHVIDIIHNRAREGLFHVSYEEIKKLKVHKNPTCKVCNGEYTFPQEPITQLKFCGRNLYQIKGKKVDSITYLKDITLFPDGRALVKAESEQDAISKYSKFVGN